MTYEYTSTHLVGCQNSEAPCGSCDWACPWQEPWKRCLGPSQEMPTRCWLPAPACMSLTRSHLNCLLGAKETGPWSPVGRMVSLEDDFHRGASDAACCISCQYRRVFGSNCLAVPKEDLL